MEFLLLVIIIGVICHHVEELEDGLDDEYDGSKEFDPYPHHEVEPHSNW
jgi:hypothetical protein